MAKPSGPEPATITDPEVGEAGPAPSGELRDPPPGDRGRYRIERELGRGGRGRIWLARDLHLDRLVALKEPIDDRPQTVARFAREALVTARLQHPSIVPVYETGRWDRGAPYYAMRHVEGRTLGEAIDGAGRLALLPHVIAAADAIAYAHGEGVIHRDLKPSNVLCGPFGETVVLDWGLAQVRGRADVPGGVFDVVAHPLTRDGAVVGTPAYMPPEQARGEPVDERADVYALGAMLHHVLAGAPPYRGDDVLAQVEAGPPRRLTRADAPDELAAIVGRAMARDRSARYPSARELAADLRRFAAGQLVRAHDYSAAARLARWVGRRRALVAVAAAAVAALAITIGLAGVRVIGERDAARRSAAIARARADALVLSQAAAALDRDPAAALAWLASYPATGADHGRARALAVDALSRGPARHVWRSRGAVNAIAVAPDGRTLATGGGDLAIQLWDVAGGGRRARIELGAQLGALAFSPDGATLYAADLGGALHVVDTATGARRGAPLGRGALFLVQVGGGLVAAGGEWGAPVILTGGGVARTLGGGVRGARLTALAIAPGGARVITGAADGAVRIWDVDGERAPRTVGHHAGPVADLVLAADGASVITGGDDGTIARWTLDGGGAPAASAALGAPVIDLALTADGATLAVACGDRTVRVLGAGALDAPIVLTGLPAAPTEIAFAPGGDRVAAGAADGAVIVWDLPDGTARRLLGHTQGPMHLAFIPDGAMLATGGGDGAARLWSMAGDGGRAHRLTGVAAHLAGSSAGAVALAGDDGRLTLIEPGAAPRELGRADAFSAVTFSRDGARVIAASWDHRLRAWDVTGGGARVLDGGDGMTWALAVAPRGDRLAAAGQAGLRVWDGDGAARVLAGHAGDVRSVAFLDEARLLSGGTDRTLRLWDLARGGGRVLSTEPGEVYLIAASPDGRHAAAATLAGVRLWDLERGTARELAAPALVRWMAFSPDGARLAATTAAGPLPIWDVATGARRDLAGPASGSNKLAFSPDGARIASTGWDGTLRVWRVADGVDRIAHRFDGMALDVAWLGGAAPVAASGADGSAWLGPADGAWLDADLGRAIAAATTVAIDATGAAATAGP